MRKQIFLVGLFMCLLSITTNGQDGLFSNFIQNKSLLNPSLFSIQNDPIAINIQYREQGASVSSGLPIRTFLANANYVSNSQGSDKMSFGLSVLGDKGGEGHFSKSMAHLNFSYLKRLSGTYSKTGIHFIGIGAQAGAGQHSAQWNRFWFGNQYDRNNGVINTSLDSGEQEINSSARGTSSIFYDINAGVNWYSYVNANLSVYAGYAMFHLNRPNISLFEEGEDRLAIRNAFHMGLTKIFSEGFQLKPKMFFSRQIKSSQFIVGTEIGINNEDVFELVLDFGMYTRFVNNYDRFGTDAVILSLNLGYQQFNFSLAYDITVSQLSRYNGSKGAWELNVNYSIPGKRKTNDRSQVKFRQ